MLIVWILSGYINLGTSITATFTYCFCHHSSNDEYKSLYHGDLNKYCFYESGSKTRFYYYYYFLLLFIYVQYYYYHYNYGVILLTINIIIIIHIIILIMDIIHAYFNESWYHVVSLKLSLYSDLFLCDF